MYAYIYKMSWFKTVRHRISHTDMYFAEEEHTRWGHDDPSCRIEVIQAIKGSNVWDMAQSCSQSAVRLEIIEIKKLQKKLACMRMGRNPIMNNYLMRKVFIPRLRDCVV